MAADAVVWSISSITARVPLIGDVQAAGTTLGELTDRLTQEFAKKIKVPQVTVTLREVNSYRIYYLGKVAKPGVPPAARSPCSRPSP